MIGSNIADGDLVSANVAICAIYESNHSRESNINSLTRNLDLTFNVSPPRKDKNTVDGWLNHTHQKTCSKL